jgi:glycosyltransferase involved in cell wall biosynthesis
VICGRIGQENYYGEIMRFIRSRPGLSDRVKFIHTAGNDEVLALYNESRMCILPSVYEGFGIPVLEAQACGCPMLCSSIGPLMEVGGRGAFYCDPENVESIADAMKRLLQSESLQEDLRRKGFENSAKFTWEKTALAYREIYQRVARK